MKPTLVEEVEAGAELVVIVVPLLNETVTVSGSAPSIEVHAGGRHHHAQRPRTLSVRSRPT